MQLTKMPKVRLAVVLEIFREIKRRTREDLLVKERERDKEAPDSAVSIQERM